MHQLSIFIILCEMLPATTFGWLYSKQKKPVFLVASLLATLVIVLQLLSLPKGH